MCALFPSMSFACPAQLMNWCMLSGSPWAYSGERHRLGRGQTAEVERPALLLQWYMPLDIVCISRPLAVDGAVGHSFHGYHLVSVWATGFLGFLVILFV